MTDTRDKQIEDAVKEIVQELSKEFSDCVSERGLSRMIRLAMIRMAEWADENPVVPESEIKQTADHMRLMFKDTYIAALIKERDTLKEAAQKFLDDMVEMYGAGMAMSAFELEQILNGTETKAQPLESDSERGE